MRNFYLEEMKRKRVRVYAVLLPIWEGGWEWEIEVHRGEEMD